MFKLYYEATLSLQHGGDCILLGATPDLILYVEELYGAEPWVAQHRLQFDGTILETRDEADSIDAFIPFELPAHAIRPAAVASGHPLDFSGPRLQGLRATDRIDGLVRSLPMQIRMNLAQTVLPGVMPPLILGLVESRVLAACSLNDDAGTQVICRRVGVACALSGQRVDESGIPYDYETKTLFLAHTWREADGLDLEEIMTSNLPGADLYRPMDCLLVDNTLVVADGGDGGRTSVIHLWRVDH